MIKIREYLNKIKEFIIKYRLYFLIMGVVLSLSLPLFLSNYWLGILCRVLFYATLAGSLNVITGYSGQMNIGHAGFVSIGAYVGAIIGTRLGWHFIVQLILGGICAGIVAWGLSKPILRLRGTYMAIITMGFCETVRIIALNWTSITGGTLGLKNIPVPVFFGLKINSPKYYYYIFIILLAVFLFFTRRILDSRVGRAWISIREDETASKSLGVKLAHYRSINMVYGAVWAGILGAAIGPYYRYISPDMFNMDMSFNIQAMVILGGQGTLIGPVFGAIIITLITELFRFAAEWRMIFYAVLIIVMMWIRPQGIIGASNSVISGKSIKKKGSGK